MVSSIMRSKTKMNPILRHIYNADCPLLMSEDIRGVIVRGFPVSIFSLVIHVTLFAFCESSKVSYKKKYRLD